MTTMLSPVDAAVLDAITQRASNGYAERSTAALMAATGLSRGRLHIVIKRLIDAGHLTPVSRKATKEARALRVWRIDHDLGAEIAGAAARYKTAAPARIARHERAAAGERVVIVDGKRLVVRALRERRHWSQTALAAAAGVGDATIVRLEAGSAVPKNDTLDRIAAALDVNRDALFASE